MNKIEELEKEFENLVDEFEKKLEDLKKRFDECEKSENKRWRAEKNKNYFYIGSELIVDYSIEVGDIVDNGHYKIHNYFKTQEEAEKVAEKIKIYVELKDLAEELSNGEEIDWGNDNQRKYCIYKDYPNCNLDFISSVYCSDLGQIYCLNENFLKIAKERIGEERLLKLFE